MGVCLRCLANIFLLLFLCSNKSYVYGVRELADHHAEEVKSLMPPSTCSPSTNQGLQIARRDGPCAPLGEENPSRSSREILLQDESRVRALSSISSNSDDYSGQGAALILQKKSERNDNYFVTVGFGTPTRELTLMFDTGSSVTWIQCKPCDSCYEQDERMYDPLESSTFSNASCINNPDTCSYDQHYNDGSHSRGYNVKDTLTLSNVPVHEFAFGCGQDNSDDFGGAAGLLGFGWDDISLMSQTVGDFGKMFCYCLPSGGSNGYVVFGNKARETCYPEHSIPLLKATNNGYFISLVAITIDQQRLYMPSNSGSSRSAMIDSGTLISRLPPSVYSQLSSTFRALMSNLYPVEPVPQGKLLDTCYDLESYDKKYIPRMTLHFSDTLALNLPPSAVVHQDTNSRYTCLAFAPNKGENDNTIIGSHQLRDMKIYFDVKEDFVGFSIGCGT